MPVKRYYENPQRNWVIWFMDILKQFLGILMIHCFNVVAAENLSSTAATGDECSWYFIIYVMDVVFTTALSFIVMKQLDIYFSKNGYPVSTVLTRIWSQETTLNSSKSHCATG